MNYGDNSTNMVSCLIYYASYSDGSGSVTSVEIVSNSIVPNVGAFLGLLSDVLFFFLYSNNNLGSNIILQLWCF